MSKAAFKVFITGILTIISGAVVGWTLRGTPALAIPVAMALVGIGSGLVGWLMKQPKFAFDDGGTITVQAPSGGTVTVTSEAPTKP